MPGAVSLRFHDEMMYTLRIVGNDGQLIGYLAGEPIFESVYDIDGRAYGYVGVASRLRNGHVDLTALSENHRLVAPGLIYEPRRDESRVRELEQANEPISAKSA